MQFLASIKELIESSNSHRKQAENDLQKVVAIMSGDVEMIHRRVKDVRAVIGNSQSTGKIQESVDETKTLVQRLKETIEEGVHNFKHHRIGFETPFVCWTIVIETVLILGLFTWIIISEKPNQDRIDNDLKYRYIKMKGDASAEQIANWRTFSNSTATTKQSNRCVKMWKPMKRLFANKLPLPSKHD